VDDSLIRLVQHLKKAGRKVREHLPARIVSKNGGGPSEGQTPIKLLIKTFKGMKKFWKLPFPANEKAKKLILTMKLTVFILFLTLMQVSATVYSQATKFSFRAENKQVVEVLRQIEESSNFRFFFLREQVDVERKVTVTARDATVEQILDELFRGEHVSYEFANEALIVITRSDNPLGSVSSYLHGNIQQPAVSGTVTDEFGEPLPGVTVVVKGTTQGTVTNADGNYSLANIPEDATLVFSFVGMRTQEIPIGNQTSINVEMEVDAIGIEEVVAIGYGTRKKKDLTGAVSQIDSEELQKEIKMSPELAMQGKMAGVYISNPGSSPTTRPTVRIRGISTLGFNDPLYVIDGVPLTEGGASSPLKDAAGNTSRDQDQRGNINVFSLINPNDIESISVLKDASATAIYGVRASNGVILITTKRGSKGKMNINLSARYGIQNIYKDYDVLNTQQYVEMHREAWANNPSFNEDPDILRFYDPNSPAYLGDSPTYDWQAANKIKNAPIQDYNISISGGNDVSNYSVGAGYTSQEDPMFFEEYQRYSFSLNSDHNLTSWLKMGETFRFVYSKDETYGGGDAFAPPWQPLYDPDGFNGYALPGGVVEGEFTSRAYGNSTRSNFLGTAFLDTNFRNLFRNIGSFYAEVSPLEGLRFKGSVSYDYYTNNRENYSKMESSLFDANQGTLSSDLNVYRNMDNININIVKEFLIGYNNSFGNHNVDLVLNAMDQRVDWNIKTMLYKRAANLTSWFQRRIEEGAPPEDKVAFYERNPSGLLGYMGRLSYNFDSKYYLDATVRQDGTSKFGPGYKWGTFPSFAAAWRITSEPFMQGIEALDDLKIRAGWGQSGNQETKNYAFISLVNINPKYALGDGGEAIGNGSINQAAALGDFPIVDMSWETVTSTNIGFDAILLNNRLSFTAEYYYQHTDDILQQISIPLVIGALNDPVVNLAKVENSGMEFQAGYNDRFGEIGFNASFNLTTVKNEVKKLYRGRPQGGTLRIEEGQSMNYIYGYKVGGIFQTEEEVTAWKEQYTDPGRDDQKAPGDMYFEDLFGAPDPEIENQWVGPEPDGKIDDFDRTYLGKTIPGFYYGINLNLDYKQWDLSMNFRGVGDVQKINDIRRAYETMGVGGSNFLSSVLNRWTPDNPSSTMPKAVAADPSGNNRMSDRWVEDAGFLRFQNLQLGYTFKADIMNKVGISTTRLYLSGSNLFVITPYSGLDPENDTTPVTFTAGVNINF
jgi:TonB-dependent starch-binding outer membrane protein SusC